MYTVYLCIRFKSERMTYKGQKIEGFPTLAMVREYIEGRNYKISPEKVYEHYAANKWKTSKGHEVETLEAAINGCNSASEKFMLTSEERREEYKRLLQTQEWEDFRKAVLAHYGSKCQKCGATRNLQVHHKAYRNSADKLPWAYFYEDLQVLCEKCHNEAHGVQIINKV